MPRFPCHLQPSLRVRRGFLASPCTTSNRLTVDFHRILTPTQLKGVRFTRKSTLPGFRRQKALALNVVWRSSCFAPWSLVLSLGQSNTCGAPTTLAASPTPEHSPEPTAPVFRPIRSQRAFEEIATQIRSQLSEGKLRVGNRLPSERALAEQFGVSRNTLREALGNRNFKRHRTPQEWA